MTSQHSQYRRRELLRIGAGGVAGALCLSTPATAQSDGDAPDPDAYEDIIAEMDGDGSEENPYVVTDVVELQALPGDLSSSYELGGDIDASATESWNDGAGFTPIGTQENPFSGRVNGNGNGIQGLTIDRPDTPLVGTFGLLSGVVEQLTVTGSSITGAEQTGCLAGACNGGLSNVTVGSSVTGTDRVGGVVGQNNGQILKLSAETEVSGSSWVGGIAGGSRGGLDDSSVTSDVTGTEFVGTIAGTNTGQLTRTSGGGTANGEVSVGGCIGDNSGTVFATTGSVTVDGEETVGGFVGENWSEIGQSTVEGTVTGTKATGGFVGENYKRINGVSSASDVSGETLVGGLAGWNGPGGTITSSYVTGTVSGEETVGALVGRLGWEFQDDGIESVLRTSYWNSDDIQHDAVGTNDQGSGETTVESVGGLETSAMQGEAATSNMQGMDFSNIWRPIPEKYPQLRVFTSATYEIIDSPPEQITVRRDEEVSITVTVRNSGNWPGTKMVELRVEGETARAEELSLDPGEKTTMTLSFSADQLGPGGYDYAVWTPDGETNGVILIERGSQRTEETDTATESPGDSPDDTETDATEDGSDGDGPGFGIPAALSGLGGAAYLLSQRVGSEES